MNRKILVANWKMNPQRESEAIKLTKAIDAKNVVICPPFPFFKSVKSVIKKASLGAQDAFWEERGAYTGEVSPLMLKKLGVDYVIIGHSERRRWLHETDEMINKKVKVALKVGLKAILCVGEPLSVRKKGLQAAKNFVKNQLREDLKNIYNLKPKTYNLIVAYEPIWAIGTGKPDNPKETAEMSRFIKEYLKPKTYNLKPKVLYGGSVTSLNIGRILEYNEIQGALVGGASLKVNEFKKIIKIASK
ncbi:MAG: triose-phosphate isomerase [Candidatus Liptonbacteria bacterium]|nr:triose-phosphate isomerase [Candidatus Liptonbacteria bacterium]